jgi:alanine racemase
MNHGSYRDTWVEVDLGAIQHNVKSFKEHIHNECKLMAVVKADGYGHGAIEVAKAAIGAGADYLAVAILDEAISLREANIKAPILILGYTSPNAVKTAIQHDITLTVFTQDVLDQVIQTTEELKKNTHIHIKIDSGMNRIGIKNKEEALKLIHSNTSSFVTVEGIFTHFAQADDPDSSFTEKQFSHFQAIVDYLEQHDVHIPIKHCCNSAATIAYPEKHLDMVRVGVSLYGLYPSEHLRDKISLRQAMSFKTKPVLVKMVNAGESISYGCTFTTNRVSTIATIPVGYADGLSRSISNKGNVTVKGKRAPIVGRICMDQSMIDVTGVGAVNEDDIVTIFGDPDHGYISLGEVAEQMNTIHYETVCLIGKRVPRVYVNNENKT